MKRILLGIAAVALVFGEGLITAVPAEAANEVMIKSIGTATAPYGGTAVIKPQVVKRGNVKILAQHLTVKLGRTYVTKNKPTATLRAGRYTVTTTVKYQIRGKKIYGSIKTKTKSQSVTIKAGSKPVVVKQPVAPTPPVVTTPPLTPENTDQPCGPTIYKVDGSKWTCTFADDFNGSTLDSSKWMVGETAKTGFTTGKDCYIDNPDNVAVSGGQLHLSSRTGAKSFVCQSPFGDFETVGTAGTVVSYGKFAQTYGRFEFRAKFPNTPAFAGSALWMFPQNPAYGKWPNSGEIDVAEWFGTSYADHVYPSLHYAGETGSTGYNCVVKNASTAFHNYAVNWTSTEMSFYYDGQLCFQHVWAPNAPLAVPQPFDQAFDLVMTQTGAYYQPAGTKITMDIDWVRAWK